MTPVLVPLNASPPLQGHPRTLHEWIRTRVASSFRVVEEAEDRLALQANWLNYLGGAAVFMFLGVTFLGVASTFRALVSWLTCGGVGVAFCIAGVAAIAIGRSQSHRRIVFDRKAAEVRVVYGGRKSSRIPLGDIATLQQRTIEGVSDIDSTLVYHVLYLVTKHTDEIELCKSRDPQVIAELEAKVRRLI